jgi:hypothetical protein
LLHKFLLLSACVSLSVSLRGSFSHQCRYNHVMNNEMVRVIAAVAVSLLSGVNGVQPQGAVSARGAERAPACVLSSRIRLSVDACVRPQRARPRTQRVRLGKARCRRHGYACFRFALHTTQDLTPERRRLTQRRGTEIVATLIVANRRNLRRAARRWL